jgi:NTE family protein
MTRRIFASRPAPSCPRRPPLRAVLAALLVVATGCMAFPVAGASAASSQGSDGARARTCLVLSGGGARGAAHVGVLKVLEEMRIPVDCVVGTSMGSIVGGAWVAGTPIAEMESALRTARWDVVLGDEPARPERSWRSKELERLRIFGAEFGVRDGKAVLPSGAVIGQQLEGFLRTLLGPPIDHASFDEFPVRFRALATDIENGGLVVLSSGTLNAAVRASMSVPGAFSPQEIGGRLLVDGGLVRNLGVDVARGLGAERIIAVNLGTTLSPRDEINSLLGVTSQMINILTEQNVQRSLAELGPSDLLITPELGSFSAANFAEAWTTIELGERAARQVADRLRAFAVPESEYRRWQAAHLRPLPQQLDAGSVRVDTSGLERVNAAALQATFDEIAAEGSGPVDVDRAVAALYATDDFEQVSLRTRAAPNGTELVISPREKAWGPNYVRLGTTLSTDLDGRSAFTVFGDLRATWLNSRGLEWRTSASLGDVVGLRSELLQPIDLRRRWLAGVYVDGRRRVDEVYVGEEPVGRFRDDVIAGGIEMRSRYATDAEFVLGVRRTYYQARQESGVPIANIDTDATSVYGQAVFDRLDDWDFPRSGSFARLEVEHAFAALGGDEVFDKALVEFQKSFGQERHSLSLLMRYGTAFGGNLPLLEGFALGGFQNLSGFGERQLIANQISFGRAVYGYEIASGGALAKRLFLGGSLEVGDLSERLNIARRLSTGNADTRNFVAAGSIFVAADTVLGPVYFGAGLGEGGERALYIFLGRP